MEYGNAEFIYQTLKNSKPVGPSPLAIMAKSLADDLGIPEECQIPIEIDDD